MLFYAPENEIQIFNLTNEDTVKQFVEELNKDIEHFLIEYPNEKVRLDWNDIVLYNFGSIKLDKLDLELSSPCADFDILDNEGKVFAYFSIPLDDKIGYYMECWTNEDEEINILRLQKISN